MSDLYTPWSPFIRSAEGLIRENMTNGKAPEEVAAAIAAAQLNYYRDKTDPAIRDDPRHSKGDDFFDWQREQISVGSEGYRLVSENKVNSYEVAGAAARSALSNALRERTGKIVEAKDWPRILYDKDQVEPYRYDRATDALFINQTQLRNPDTKALHTALDIRDDRSDKRLTHELYEQALPYAEDKLPPAYIRAANRVQEQARVEGWSDDKVGLRDAMVEAAYPHYRDATDPANPEATKKARDEFFARPFNFVTPYTDKVTEKFHPEILAMVNRGTATLNNLPAGQNYSPPSIAIVVGELASSGSPASFNPTTDTIILDADYVRENPEALEGVIGHELGHRYQREPADLKGNLHMIVSGILDIPVDPKVMSLSRTNELEADTNGAQLVGPAEMKADLNQSLGWAASQGAGNVAKEPEQAVVLDSALAEENRTHPLLATRNAKLDALLAQKGLSKQCYAPQSNIGITDVEKCGPSASPVKKPAQQQEASVAR